MDPKQTPPADNLSARIRLSELAQRKSHSFSLLPDADARKALAQELDILAIKKLSFVGQLHPTGQRDWDLTAKLGVTVVQACVATLEPVTTRIDEPVERQYRRDLVLPDDVEDDGEVELPENDSLEPLPEVLVLADVMREALSLSLPPYPRANGADPANISVTEPGVKPMTDDDAKPFAGLADLKQKLERDDNQ